MSGPQPTSGGYPAYPPAGYPGGAPTQNTSGNVFGIIALILGILSIPLFFGYGAGGLIFGGAGIVLGILGMKKATAGQATNRGMSLAGVICGGVGAALGVIYIVLLILGTTAILYTCHINVRQVLVQWEQSEKR